MTTIERGKKTLICMRITQVFNNEYIEMCVYLYVCIYILLIYRLINSSLIWDMAFTLFIFLYFISISVGVA